MEPASMQPEHRAYVCSTWAHGARYRRGRGQRVLFGVASRLANGLLDGGAEVRVIASGPTVHAWACARVHGSATDVLHYVYVPLELRGSGMARRLIESLFGQYPERVDVSHPWPFESDRFRFVPKALLNTIETLEAARRQRKRSHDASCV